MKAKLCLFIIITTIYSSELSSQTVDILPDSINKNRLRLVTSTLSAGYGVTTYLLNKTWYQDYPRSSFHFFNDWGEWEQMDKLGHIYSAYFQSNYAYQLYKWSGLPEGKSILYGSLTAILFQSTIEVLDGFSSQWGFSLPDFGANIIGVSLFAIQQKKWQDQRILIKMSGGISNYSGTVSSDQDMTRSILLDDRANDLFGSSSPSRFLKDYNRQTIWMSMNLKSILQSEKLPEWLNLSIGYGAENMFGGFSNTWDVNGLNFTIPENSLDRYHQFYLSPDIDLSKIKTNKKAIRTILDILNIFKFPLPTLEYATNGKVLFHLLKF